MMSSLSIQAEDTPSAKKVALGQAPQTRAPAVRPSCAHHIITMSVVNFPSQPHRAPVVLLFTPRKRKLQYLLHLQFSKT